MSEKIKFSIEPEKTGAGVVKIGNLEPTDFTQNQDLLSKADRFDATNVRGRLRLNDTNFYNYQKYYKKKKREMEESHEAPDMMSFAYAHQIQTVETILKLPTGGLLADQVGMGKTIEAGMLIAELAYRDEWRTLIITLSNDELLRNWHDEMFDKFGLNLALVKGNSDDDVQKVFDILCDYQKTGIIKDYQGNRSENISGISYDYLGALVPFSYLVDDRFISLVSEYNEKNPLKPFHIDLIVVDESHRYTSKDAASSDNKINALHHLQMKQKILFNGEERIEKQGKILLLTATPIKNDLRELISLMQIIDPKYTEEDFKKDLDIGPKETLDLTTVLEKNRGVNRWWEWFTRFGERHTRLTTLYDPEKRKYGVHWKKKNSHSYYFNNNYVENGYPVREYFKDDKVAHKIKPIKGEPIDRAHGDTELKGERESFVQEYEAYIPNLDMDRFNKLLRIIAYLKHEISKEELQETKFDLKKDGLNIEVIDRILSKNDFNRWHESMDAYSSLGNLPLEIEKKKIIEGAVSAFILNLTFINAEENYSLFFEAFFKYLNNKLKDQQKDSKGMQKIKNYDKLALILCSDNLFLQIEKMQKLGEIINSPKHCNEKIIIFCKDDSERRMLVENAHLWDFKGRYMDNDSVARISNLSKYDMEYIKFSNVVSIAYTTDAEGLNLQSYHTMINYSILLSPLHMEQRIGRIDRIGQRNDMDIYFFANAQDVEGYVLRFFEYELELFSNWSGDTTASTYYDAKRNGKEEKLEFDVAAKEFWDLSLKLSMDRNEQINRFEESAANLFNNVRDRVNNIAGHTKEIDHIKESIDVVNKDDLDMYGF
ncbi:MAG: DEAD/DEAH box helicase family protein [Acholeplasmatales bacterium]|nr:DEAD/DEAH box helicase family protein [Acholeplasmatales bacterium]